MPRPARRPQATRRPRVALLIETSNAYARGLLKGIVRYIGEHASWSLQVREHSRGDDSSTWLARWDGDGIIARIETPRIARAVLAKRLPTVDVSAARLAPGLPWVETDDDAVAALAAGHLLERGLRHLAFCGDVRFNWSRWRQTRFVEHVRVAGRECHVYSPRGTPASVNAESERLRRWLKSLPRPVGIMAAYDLRGQQLLDVCRDAGIPVPEEVAIIGVDDDELLCHLATPPLSSVIPDTVGAGYRAAALLDELMLGGKPSGQAHLIPPLGVAARQSTDLLAITDEHVAGAVRFIRTHACAGIDVGDVVRKTPLSRRVLERRFQRALGHTPRKEILTVRLRRVRHLLSDTDLPFHQIAERTGFRHAEYLSVAFKRETGRTPSHYRATTRRQRERS
jgi:LacI family transcriptional regulator